MAYIESDPRYSAPDAMATEYEVADFMYGLVRLLKPEVLIETGCYRGDMSVVIGKALLANGSGCLYTCDTDPEMVNITENRVKNLPVKVIQCTGHSLCNYTESVDLAFLDSSGDRFQEALALKMSDSGVVVLHDAIRPYDLESIFPRVVSMPTPRGLKIFY